MIECKQALLDKEISEVKKFLATQDLLLDDDCDVTLYLEENGKIIGTISKSNYVIKCVAIDPAYQGEDLAGMLVNKIVEKLTEESIYSYQVFTKRKYELLFISMGFNKIASSKDSVMLEKGLHSIYDTIKEMKQLIVNNLGPISEDSDIGCIVMNANPFTLGHQYLVEEVLKRHEYVLIFLVEEDKSIFSFEERKSLAYLATSRYENLLIIPSSRYMVSTLTFPTYFIHSLEQRSENAATLDATIFKEYFMKNLFIKKRYVGSETKDYMVLYNKTLKNILEDSLEEIERCSIDETTVSASYVRNLLENHKLDEALKYIPQESSLIFRLLAAKKYGC